MHFIEDPSHPSNWNRDERDLYVRVFAEYLFSGGSDAAARRAVLFEILGEARQALADGTKVNVMTDGGSENLVIRQDAELAAVAEHVVAQVDVVQSNSMVESLWNQLRHRWLYLHQLDSFAGLESLIAKYFIDHNTLIPRVGLGGRTPDEAYLGREVGLMEKLKAGHLEARDQRVATNRAVSCRRCSPPQQAPPTSHLSIVP